MRRTTIGLFFALFVVSSALVRAQTADSWFTEKLGADEVRADLRVLVSALHELHGGLFLYADSTHFAAECEATAERLAEGATRANAYREMARLVDHVRDGHTWIFPSEDDAQRLIKTQVFIPFTIEVSGTAMYVDSCYAVNGALPSGARLVAIDGRPIRAVVAELLPYFTADGSSLAGKLGGLESQFWWYYGLHYGFNDYFEIVYEFAGLTRSVQLEALKMATLRERFSRDAGSEKPVSWSVDNGVAYLRVASFSGYSLPKYRRNFNRALESFHAAGCSELIIDLRGNGGGREGVENLLISCLGQHCADKYDQVAIRRPVAKSYTHMQQPVRRRLEDWVYRLVEFRKDESGTWNRRSRFKRSFYMPNHPFTKPTSVLVDRNTFSGAAEFAALVRDHVPGLLIIGEETCGGYQGHVSGYSYEIRLPNTAFELHVPRVHFDLNVPGSHAGGVLPHIYMSDRHLDVRQVIERVVYQTRKYNETTAFSQP